MCNETAVVLSNVHKDHSSDLVFLPPHRHSGAGDWAWTWAHRRRWLGNNPAGQQLPAGEGEVKNTLDKIIEMSRPKEDKEQDREPSNYV